MWTDLSRRLLRAAFTSPIKWPPAETSTNYDKLIINSVIRATFQSVPSLMSLVKCGRDQIASHWSNAFTGRIPLAASVGFGILPPQSQLFNRQAVPTYSALSRYCASEIRARYFDLITGQNETHELIIMSQEVWESA